MHSSLSGDSPRSLSIRLTGTRVDVWADLASAQKGDALDLVAHVRFPGAIKEASAWSRAWLGLTGAQPERPPADPGPPPKAPTQGADADQAARRAKAKGPRSVPLGKTGSQRLARGSLSGRAAIDLAELGRSPRALRFHPAVWCAEVAAPLPVMPEAITNGEGEHIATHRTWLSKNAGGNWTKASLQNAKKTFGSYAGGFIPLQRGASTRSLRMAPEGEWVAIAEGIETALSVAVVCPELRVLAAVSLSNLARITLPEAVRTVIVCMDNDRPDNIAAEQALVMAIRHFSGAQRTVRLARPPMGEDFNDTLRAEALS